MGKRLRGISAAAAAVLVATGTAASADNISNKLGGSVDAAAEVMTLNSGGAAGTTTLGVHPANKDGVQGCNFGQQDSQGMELVVTAWSSDATVATVSPTQLTFTKCGEGPSLTVSPVKQGTTTISFTERSNNTGASFDLSGATFTVVVAESASVNSAPTIEVTGVTSGDAYEIGTVPVAGCEVTDVEDQPTPFPATLTAISGPLAGFGLGSQTASCSYTDAGGLTATSSVTYQIVDTTAPVIAFESRTPAANGNGWNNTDVTVTWTCTDAGSGAVADTVEAIVTGEGSDLTAEGTCADHAGNTAAATVTGINIDRTAPTLSWVGGPADGASPYFGSVPAAPTCTAEDSLSGVADGCVVSGYGAAVGSHTLAAAASDKAGNTTIVTRSYTVLAWTLKGFYQPVDMGGVLNTVKAGSTVPLKFEVFAATELTSTTAVASFRQAPISGNPGTADDLEFTTTGGTTLRYDSTAGQFVQNWQTPKVAGACYRVTMTTQDGSTLSADFRLK